jgi:hypothetical protein
MSYGIRSFITLFSRKSAIVLTVVFITSNLVFYFTNVARNTYKAEYQKAISSIEYEPATDIILHPHAFTFHSFNYYSDLPNYIYDPNRNLPHFEGLAYISDGDYYDGNLADFTRLWTLYLWNDDGFDKKLNTQGFVEVEKKRSGMGLFVKLFEKEQIKSTPQKKVISPAKRRSGNKE